MKKKFVLSVISLIFLGLGVLYSQPVVTVTQVDTFAIKGMSQQCLLKVHVTNGDGYSLNKLMVKSFSEDSLDIDSVAIYRTLANRFSAADYESDWVSDVELITKRKKFSPGDSLAIFDNLTYPLQSDLYIWILLDLSKKSTPGHNLRVSIPKNGILINSVSYSPSEQFSNTIAIRQKYFAENFEKYNTSNFEPLVWSQQCVTECEDGGARWMCKKGGYGVPDNPGSRNPNSTKSGLLNARLANQSYTPHVTWLISKGIDLSLATKPKMTFYHAQQKWTITGGTDSVGVYYKLGATGAWKFLKNYTVATPAGKWEKRELSLPDEAVNNSVFIGFRGTAQYGFGTCLDSIVIYESGISPREVNAIVTTHPQTSFVPQSATKNPVLRSNIRIKGNTGSIVMNSFVVTSMNTSDADLSGSGVRLYYTSDSVFESPRQIGTAQSFVAGKATFSSLNRKVETGDNYFWVTYDVLGNAQPDDLLDAKIVTGDILLTGVAGTFPATDQSPDGNRIIKQSIFFDDFESDKGWGLRGEFQQGVPLGKGGKQLGGDSYGKADPTYAFSNSNVIGTDLTTDGDYTNGHTIADADTATSPLIQAKYFKNTGFFFQRWLNVDSQDSAVVEYKYSGESNWRFLWGNKQFEYQEGSWSPQSFDTKLIFDRKNFRLRFRMGPTSVINRYSGWNIDYLFVTGDSIKYDAAVTRYISPVSSCSLTSTEHFKVKVKNSGPKTLVNVPIKASMDGGKNWVTETIPGPIAVDDSIDYSFSSAFDLSKPAIYSVIVKVAFPQDNFKDNDSVNYKLTSIPTYSLPYQTGFEKDTSFWTAGGPISSWQQKIPYSSNIKTAGEGLKSWVTDSTGYYKKNENSYVESPCFSFVGTEVPMIDLKISHQTSFKNDGAEMQYSIDNGVTWNYLPKDPYSFSWAWYNDVIQTLTPDKGWTGLAGGAVQPWTQNRQVLPADVSGKNKVKFRVAFKSDKSLVPITSDGLAFDDVKFYNAPYDVGVTSIDNLVPLACESGFNSNPNKVKVTVKNFGIRDVRLNDTIIIGIKANNAAAVIDTFKLSAALAVGASQQFTMTKAINIATKGNYKIKAYTLIEKDRSFYGAGHGCDNDTSVMNIVVNPNPVTGLKDTIYTNRPAKAKITAIDSAYFNYAWTYPKTSYSLTGYYPVLEVKNTGLGRHRLTVTNSLTGCISKDSSYVKLLVSDIGINKVIKPVDNCGYGTALKPIVEIKNFGTDTLKTNDTIPLRLVLDGGAVLKDTIFLTSKLDPGSILQATMNKTSLNLSVAGSHTLKAYTAYPADTTLKNDTVPTAYRSFQIYGFPTVELGPDILVQKTSYTIRPVSTSGVTSFKWSDGNVTDSMVVTQSGKYVLTVANAQGCEMKDSLNVRLKIHDIGVKRLTGPLSSCSLPKDTLINLSVKNFGTDTIKVAEPVQMKYRINDTAFYSKTLILPHDLLPGDSLVYVFDKRVNLSKITTNKIMVGAEIAGDIRTSNDSTVNTVQIFGSPHPDLGPSTIIKDLQYTLDPGIGFKSYVWQDGSTDSSYVITRTHNHDPNRLYKVTVTDQNGCSASATATIYLQVYDLEMSQILQSDGCTKRSDEDVVLKITNKGYYGPVDNDITVWYKINNETPVTETFRLKANDGISQLYTFVNKADLSATGTYKITAGLSFGFDVIPNNDTLSQVVNVYGIPQISFATDTLTTDLPATIDAGSGAGYTYLWNSGETTQTISATATGPYAVIVSNAQGCSASRGIYVKGNLTDLSVNGFSIPETNCTLTNAEKVGLKLKNTGNVTLTGQSVVIKYQINGGTEKTQTISFTGAPGTINTYQFDGSEDLSAANVYTFKTAIEFANDKVSSNNAADFVVNVFGLPTINDFGSVNDTIKLSAWPKILDPGAGFKSYLWQDGSTNETFSVSTKGLYKVTVTDNNNCSASKSVYILNTGITRVSDLAKLSFFPNPVRDVLNVTLNLKKEESVTIQLISTSGKVELSRQLSGSELYQEQFDVYALPRGMYILKIVSKDWIVTDKVLVY